MGRDGRVPSGSVRLSLLQSHWGELRHGDKELCSYCWDSGEGLGLFPVRFFTLKAAEAKSRDGPDLSWEL